MKTNLNLPDSVLIRQYLDGTLDSQRSHELEKQALVDPFLAEALEGYSYATDPDLSLLQKSLRDRIAVSAANKQTHGITWQRLSIAAVAAVMFVSAGILYWMNSQQLTNAAKSAAVAKEASAELTLQDSLATLSTQAGGSDQINTNQPGAVQAKAAAVETTQVPQAAEIESAQPATALARTLEYIDFSLQPEWKQYQSELPSGAAEVVIGVRVSKDGRPEDLTLITGGTQKQNLEAFKRIKAGPDLPRKYSHLKITVPVNR